MVHCISSSEPDSGEGALTANLEAGDWRLAALGKDPGKPQQHPHQAMAQGKVGYVESTVTSQVGSHFEHEPTRAHLQQELADTTHLEAMRMDTTSPVNDKDNPLQPTTLYHEQYLEAQKGLFYPKFLSVAPVYPHVLDNVAVVDYEADKGAFYSPYVYAGDAFEDSGDDSSDDE